MRQSAEIQKQRGDLERNAGDEGRDFSDLFKLSTCSFYKEMSQSDPRARSKAKRRNKTKNKVGDKGNNKEMPKNIHK